MSDKQSKNTGIASCTKCGIKHKRPVGIRFKRLLNASAPLLDVLSHREDVASHSLAESGSNGSMPSKSSTVSGAQVESKLDLILKKVDLIELENRELEQKISQSKSKHKSGAMLSHRSPKKSHKCSKTCVSRKSREANRSRE